MTSPSPSDCFLSRMSLHCPEEALFFDTTPLPFRLSRRRALLVALERSSIRSSMPSLKARLIALDFMAAMGSLLSLRVKAFPGQHVGGSARLKHRVPQGMDWTLARVGLVREQQSREVERASAAEWAVWKSRSLPCQAEKGRRWHTGSSCCAPMLSRPWHCKVRLMASREA